MVSTRGAMKEEPIRHQDSFMLDDELQLPKRLPSHSQGPRHASHMSGSPSSDTTNGQHGPLSDDTISNGEGAMTETTATSSDSQHNVNGKIPVHAGSQNGATPDAIHTLGHHSRRLIQVIQKLENLCIDSTLPNLPKFVVVGDQSAGKSSIIEAICDIKLPRGTGTCTRCPFQITTSASKIGGTEWMCKVILLRKELLTVDRNGTPDWLTQDSLNPFHFATITDKALLGETLRRAQLALLNPQKDPSVFSNMAHTPDEGINVEFSPNIVSLEIQAPDLPDLSFYDLPGAINVHELGHDHPVRFVEKLVKHYVKDEKALIMLACSADQDVENSTAFKYVTQCGAKPRTIGVLTKPDLAGAHRHPALRRILLGETFQLKTWFVTKQLSQEDLDKCADVSHLTARERESRFFKDEPWGTKFKQFSQRFGIPNLQNHISHELSEHILRELPGIVDRVQVRMSEVNQELARFPPAPDSPLHDVISVITKVTQTYSSHVEAVEPGDPFRASWRKAFADLREQFKHARLEIDLGSPGYVPSVMTINSDDENSEQDPSPAPKARKGNNGLPIPSTPQRQMPRGTPRSARKKVETVANGFADAATMTLGQIRNRLNSGSDDVPGGVNPRVITQIIRDSVASWRPLVELFMANIKTIVQSMLAQGIHEHLAPYTNTQLEFQIDRCVVEFFNKLFESQLDNVEHILQCELHKPLTHNVDLMKNSSTEIIKKLKREREVKRLDEHFDRLQAAGYKMPATADRHKHIEKMGADGFDREIEAMGSPLAFYDIASAHLTDSIAKQLQFGLLMPIEKQLSAKLMTELNVGDVAYCTQLLAEDPEREKARLHLVEEHQRLTTALHELNALHHHV